MTKSEAQMLNVSYEFILQNLVNAENLMKQIGPKLLIYTMQYPLIAFSHESFSPYPLNSNLNSYL